MQLFSETYDRLHKSSNDLYETTLQLLSTNYNSIPSNPTIRKQYAKTVRKMW
jgi:hypothetical protein